MSNKKNVVVEELNTRGLSLEEWCTQAGVDPLEIEGALEGANPPVALLLSETLGQGFVYALRAAA